MIHKILTATSASDLSKIIDIHIKDMYKVGNKLQEELEYNIRHNRWYQMGVTERMMNNFIKKIRKNLPKLWADINSVKFEPLLISHPNIIFISNKEELYLWFIEYAYTYNYDSTLTIVEFLKSDKLFIDRIYKYDDMVKLLDEYATSNIIPVYLSQFSDVISSNKFKRIVRRLKLEELNL